MRPGRVYRSFTAAPSDSYWPFPLIKASRSHLSYEKMRTRMSRYPGLVYMGKPARGVIRFLPPASIGDNSLLTFDDGSNPPWVIGWDTSGDGVVAGADTIVDISAAADPGDVRDAFMVAFAADWLAGNIDIQPFTVGDDRVSFVQSAPGPDGLGWSAGGFAVNGVAGNEPIVSSEPGQWDGAILGMDGGEDPNGGDAQAAPVVTGWRRAMLFGAGFDPGKGGGGEE